MKTMENKLEVALTKEQCFICLKTYDGSIVMNTKLIESEAKKVKELHGKVVEIMKEPCAECKSYMKKGIILISVEEGSDPKNPHRTGGWWVVKEDFVKRLLKDTPNKKMLPSILEQRVMFLDHKVAEHLALFSDSNDNQEKK